MRVLVTGGAGFIGSHVVDALRTAGHEPVVLDTAPADPGILGDVRDAETVARALRGVDAVCHQAAMVGLGKGVADAPAYVGVNDLGTAVLLAEAARAGVRRLVLAGSMVVYGEGRYVCARHGTWTPAASNRPAHTAARPWSPAWSTRTPRPIRATSTPRPNWRRNTWRRPGPARPADG